MERSSIMTVQRLMRLRTNTFMSAQMPSSGYPARHLHMQTIQGCFGGSRANAMTSIPTLVEVGVACPIRPLSSIPTPLVKMMTDAIEMQRNKTQRLFDLETLGPNDWDEIESLLFWWASQETMEGLDWSWKILDRLALECSSENLKDNDMESQLKAKMTAWLNLTVNSWRLMVIDSQSPETTASNEPALMTTENILNKIDSFAPHIFPDAQTYSMIIDAEIMQDPSKAAQFAERMLEQMHQESRLNHRVEPDLVTYNSVINAWSKSGLRDAGEKSQVLLQRMEELGLKPDTISFNAAISAWANSNDPSAGERAELLLQKMLELYQADHVNVKPDTTSFNSAIAAWTNCRSAFSANKAEAILRRMLELSKQGNDNMHPDTITYNSVIDAWAKSGDPSAGKKAESLLSEMLEQYNTGDEDVKPDTFTL